MPFLFLFLIHGLPIYVLLDSRVVIATI